MEKINLHTCTVHYMNEVCYRFEILYTCFPSAAHVKAAFNLNIYLKVFFKICKARTINYSKRLIKTCIYLQEESVSLNLIFSNNSH